MPDDKCKTCGGAFEPDEIARIEFFGRGLNQPVKVECREGEVGLHRCIVCVPNNAAIVRAFVPAVEGLGVPWDTAIVVWRTPDGKERRSRSVGRLEVA